MIELSSFICTNFNVVLKEKPQYKLQILNLSRCQKNYRRLKLAYLDTVVKQIAGVNIITGISVSCKQNLQAIFITDYGYTYTS